jgi:hypothetical protein
VVGSEVVVGAVNSQSYKEERCKQRRVRWDIYCRKYAELLKEDRA